MADNQVLLGFSYFPCTVSHKLSVGFVVGNVHEQVANPREFHSLCYYIQMHNYSHPCFVPLLCIYIYIYIYKYHPYIP